MYLLPLSAIIVMAGISCSTDDSIATTTEETTANSVDCSNVSSTFTINLNPSECNVDLGIGSAYNETVDVASDTRTISINNIPDHLVGTFPNAGNPNTIQAMNSTYEMTLSPSISGSTQMAQGYEFGVLFSGVTMDPYTAEFFVGSSGVNMEWNITTLTTTVNLGLDCNHAHVQPTGKYHYHGTPSAYTNAMNIDGTEMVKVGYAADGFPMYYKYGYDEDGVSIIALESGYQLRSGSRGGDGNSAPDGCYDGTYFQDYEFVDESSVLDACNGRFGKTPDSENEYYYVITDNFPSSPLCFMGTPSQDFRFQ